MMRPILSIAFLASAVFSVHGQPASPSKPDIFSPKEAIEASVNAVPCQRDERLEGVRKLFASAGAGENDIKVDRFDDDKAANIAVYKKGTRDETIVVGAHYDRTVNGCGVTDNWTGVAIMAHVYRTLRPLITQKSYVFVAFDQEELGLVGSKRMLKNLTTPDTQKICSMVNFDSFGQAYPMALKNASSPKLLKLAEAIGKEGGLRFNSVEIPGASSDSASFIARDVPAITLSGLGNDWRTILHSSSDKLDKVNIDSVYIGYRFGLAFISKLDAAGCREFK